MAPAIIVNTLSSTMSSIDHNYRATLLRTSAMMTVMLRFQL
jgi:hypothetical protein